MNRLVPGDRVRPASALECGLIRLISRVNSMAVGWAGDGAVQDQIDATVKDAIKKARSNMRQGPGLARCEECDAEIPEARRKAVPGVRLCIACQQAADSESWPASTTAAAARTASCAEPVRQAGLDTPRGRGAALLPAGPWNRDEVLGARGGVDRGGVPPVARMKRSAISEHPPDRSAWRLHPRYDPGPGHSRAGGIPVSFCWDVEMKPAISPSRPSPLAPPRSSPLPENAEIHAQSAGPLLRAGVELPIQSRILNPQSRSCGISGDAGSVAALLEPAYSATAYRSNPESPIPNPGPQAVRPSARNSVPGRSCSSAARSAAGPSLNTCPRWPPQRWQCTSVRVMK